MSTSYYLPGSKTMFGKKKIGDIRDIRQKLNSIQLNKLKKNSDSDGHKKSSEFNITIVSDRYKTEENEIRLENVYNKDNLRIYNQNLFLTTNLNDIQRLAPKKTLYYNSYSFNRGIKDKDNKYKKTNTKSHENLINEVTIGNDVYNPSNKNKNKVNINNIFTAQYQDYEDMRDQEREIKEQTALKKLKDYSKEYSSKFSADKLKMRSEGNDTSKHHSDLANITKIEVEDSYFLVNQSRVNNHYSRTNDNIIMSKDKSPVSFRNYLNKQLSRVSNTYGGILGLKKMDKQNTDKSIKNFDISNSYLNYKMKKINLEKKTRFKQKLLPIAIKKPLILDKLGDRLFNNKFTL